MGTSLEGQDTSDSAAVPATSVPVEVLEAVDDLLVAAAAPAAPVSKKTRAAIRRLGRRLERALATETKRLRQVEKGRERLAKRERRAAAAAAETAALIVRIRDTAREAVNGPTDGAAASEAEADRANAPTSATTSRTSAKGSGPEATATETR
ncbi:MAG TPA: hypothetical protein VFJ80_09590 [Candidatus Limnocylindrales bacterium]|nr:hypothetical protein [Candidatus Limnocylindrales bacterium]